MSVDLVMGMGDDQLASQFVVLFPTGIPGGGNADAFSLRMMETLDIPENAAGEYEIKYQGLSIFKPNLNDVTDKHLIFKVRLDQQWKLFDDIHRWKTMVYNNIKGTGMGDHLTRTTMIVQALDYQHNVMKSITFKYVQLQKYKILAFDHASDTPTDIELGFLYGYYEFS